MIDKDTTIVSDFSSMISVGASERAVEAARETVLSILSSAAEEKTKRTALETLTKLCSVQNTNISNNVFKKEHE